MLGSGVTARSAAQEWLCVCPDLPCAPPRRNSFERAKVIGRNNSFIDGVFAIAFNRDTELIDMVAKLAVYLVVNMGTAMFVMFWIFLAGLPRFIWTFGATWVRAQGPCTCGHEFLA
jgi:hypothetical protein